MAKDIIKAFTPSVDLGGIAAGVVSFIRIDLDVKRLLGKYYTSINSSFLFKSRYYWEL
jgi:hypothetical protein